VTDKRIVLATPLYGVQLTPEARARLEAIDGVRLVSVSADGLVHDPADADTAMAEAEVLLRGSIPRSVLDHVVSRAPSLRWIHSASAGVDRVATDLVRSRGLVVTNARGVFSRPIAEYVVMMVLGIARRLPQLLELQRERTWQPLPGRELASLTIGIVGYGSIGLECARLLAPFGPRLVATRRHPERGAGDVAGVEVLPETDLDDLLRGSDVVIVAAPLTPETRGMIGAAQLQAMHGGAWLVNVSRGQLVDEAALRQALEHGWIGGAVLDVFEEEPLPQDSPLYETPHLIITPHTSWASDRVVERSVALFAENLRRYVAGETLLNEVDLEAGY
jgi:phosphoglycerate dehydrogenase-like enzyme